MNKKVLVVDDDGLVRRSLVTMLRQNGLIALEAANGKDGLEKASQDIDLIVTDLNMPEMNGLDMTKALRSNPKTKDLRVIILTTNDDIQSVNQAMEAGITTYLSKATLDLETITKQIINFLR